VLTLSVTPGQEEAAAELVRARLSLAATVSYSLGGALKLELPASEVSASASENETRICSKTIQKSPPALGPQL
jgi:hypothetical protein